MFDISFDNPKATSPFYIDLQLFNEGDVSSSEGDSTPDVVSTTQMATDYFNSVMRQGEAGAEQQPAAEPQVQQPQVQDNIVQSQEQLILGKFKSADDLANAYANLEAFNTRTRQELAQYQQMLNNQQMIMQQQQQQFQQPPAQEQPPQKSPEEIAAENQALLDRFYENPKDVIMDLAKQVAEQMVAPITQEREAERNQSAWNQRATSFYQAHPDMTNYKDGMLQFLEANPEIQNKENAIELAYNYARGLSYNPAPQVNPQDLARDPNFIQNYILNNPDIVRMIQSQSAQKVASTQQKSAPALIAGQAGSQITATPINTPKNLKDASNQFLNSLGLKR